MENLLRPINEDLFLFPQNFVATSIRNVLYTGRAELARWPPLMWMLVAAPRHVKDYTRGTEGRWHRMDRDGAVL